MTAAPGGTAGDDRPPADVEITAAVVRALLRSQRPDLAGLPLRHADGGWDNEMWRLGDDLAVRTPRRRLGAAQAVHEQRWVPLLARRLPLEVPEPVFCGLPGVGYPYPWTVVRWVDGTPAWRQDVGDRTAWAAALADALDCLHQPASADAPSNPFRGVPLAERDGVVRERLAGSGLAGRSRLLALWADAVAAPPWAGPPVWVHGDPHPANLVVRGDALVGLVDFSDLTSGDPAADLATGWLTFDAAGRAAFLSRLEERGAVDPATWRRARGWAVAMAVTLAIQQPGVLQRIGTSAVGMLVADDDEAPRPQGSDDAGDGA